MYLHIGQTRVCKWSLPQKIASPSLDHFAHVTCGAPFAAEFRVKGMTLPFLYGIHLGSITAPNMEFSAHIIR